MVPRICLKPRAKSPSSSFVSTASRRERRSPSLMAIHSPRRATMGSHIFFDATQITALIASTISTATRPIIFIRLYASARTSEMGATDTAIQVRYPRCTGVNTACDGTPWDVVYSVEICLSCCTALVKPFTSAISIFLLETSLDKSILPTSSGSWA